jgi:hypothetical protein
VYLAPFILGEPSYNPDALPDGFQQVFNYTADSYVLFQATGLSLLLGLALSTAVIPFERSARRLMKSPRETLARR